MGAVKSVPVLGEAVTAVECSAKIVSAAVVLPFSEKTADNLMDSAKQSFEDYGERSATVAIGQSVAAAFGDEDAKKDLGERWKKVGSSTLELVDGMPGVGHVKGACHYLAGEKEKGDQCMKAASRSLAVTVATVCSAGAAVPVIAGTAMAAGLIMDEATTLVDSAIHDEWRPSGHFWRPSGHKWSQPLPKSLKAGAIVDGILGVTAETVAAVMVAEKMNTTRTYRVLESGEASKAIKATELPSGYQSGSGINPLGETWLTESPEHTKVYLPKQQTQQMMQGNNVKLEAVQLNVDKNYYKAMKENSCIPQHGSSAANRQALSTGGKIKNVFNNELLKEHPQGKVNVGIKNSNLPEFNKHVKSVKKIDPNSWRYKNGLTKAISRNGETAANFHGCQSVVMKSKSHKHEE